VLPTFPCRRVLPAWLGALTAITLIATRAGALERLPSDWGAYLRPLERLSRTGILYDRVLPLAHLERLDGSAATPVLDRRTWRQGYDELRRAAIAAPRGPDLATLDDEARASARAGVIPLALFDRAFERVRPERGDDIARRIADGGVEPLPDDALVASRAVGAAALVDRTFRGADLAFALDPDRLFSDDPSPPRALVIDFDDGRGPVPFALGEKVRVRYAAPGPKSMRAVLTRADGTKAEARFSLDVAALAAPPPDDTLHVIATVPYQGQYGSGDAYVYRAPGHATLVNPVVVIEGFDLDNSMNWDELYAQLNQQNLLENLRADGFDAVVLNFTDATVAVEENGNLVAELIQQVQSLIPPGNSLALVGASMGGLCSRYALAYLEHQGIPHRVRVWIAFDTPNGGANVPLGLQYWLNFFSGQSADAAAYLAVLQRPAAREMLIYHFTSPATTAGVADPLRAQMLSAFSAVGDYPQLTRRVAISDGSSQGTNQGFQPGDQVVEWDYTSLFVVVQGDIWSVPNQVNHTIFKGNMRIVFSSNSQTINATGTMPWDGAPGGFKDSFAELDAVPAPYGDIVALHPNHCFVPSVSALALPTTDPFFDIAGTPNLVALTPFDAVYVPAANYEHVTVTPENAVWIRNEIEQGVLAAGELMPGAVSLAGAPDPFRQSTRLTFTLPSAGHVDLRVFDLQGREVARLVNETRSAGVHTITWDGSDERGAIAAPGMFFVRLVVDGRALVRRVVKLR
jgi:hypothetical protein